jgi:hypothetical protein
MSIKIENNNLCLPLHLLLDALDAEAYQDIIKNLACEDEIIQRVTDQILTGWTDDYHGARGCGANVEPHTPLDKARRRVAELADDVAKAELADALRALKNNQVWSDHYKDWAFMMYHAWGKQSQCPHQESPKVFEATSYEVVKKDALLDAMKEGMRRAAQLELPKGFADQYDSDAEIHAHAHGCFQQAQAILSAAEQLTEKDL